MKVRVAKKSDYEGIKQIVKQSKHLWGTLSPMFLAEETWKRKEMAVAERKGRIVGYVLIRNLKRKPWTSLHYIGVDEMHRGTGVGEKLVGWVMEQSPHNLIRLICSKDNEEAHKFYKRLDFVQEGEGSNKAGEEYYIWWLDERVCSECGIWYGVLDEGCDECTHQKIPQLLERTA